MSKNVKSIVLVAVTICCTVMLFTLPPISQDTSYHNFADQRNFFGIANFCNVISNLPFLAFGLMGLYHWLVENKKLSPNSIANLILFSGVIGIGLGSAYYHFNPSNKTLVWDRIPMTVTFMAFFSIVISRYLNKRWGAILLFPLLILGIASVLSWYNGEIKGAGDLRLYALVQFYPMIAIPIIIFMYSTPKAARVDILVIIVLYVVAKFFEHGDAGIFNVGEIISGHSVKHLFASGSILIMLRMVKREQTNSVYISG